jgi:hypothetical protein
VTSSSPHCAWLLALGSGLGDGRSYGESSSSGLVPVSVWSANAGRAARLLSAGPSEGVLVRGESRLELYSSRFRGLGLGRRVLQPRGVAFLGGQLLPGAPAMLVALLLFVALLR